MEVDAETAEILRRESNASRLRSSSVGAAPRPKRLFTTRAQSAAEAALDVRCACQFFQTTALLPERVNPIGSRPSSSMGFISHDQEQLHYHHLRLQQEDGEIEAELEAVLGRENPLGGSDFSFGPVVGDMDYYAESVSSRPNSPMHRPLGEHPVVTIPQPTIATSSMELDPCLQPKPLNQKDPATSILLHRRNSQTHIDLQVHLSPLSVPLKRNASQRSFEIVVAPICQRDPSTSSLVRKKMGQSLMASRSGSQYGLENSFIPIQAVAPISSSVSPDSRRPRGPYPGEAYPPDYEHMNDIGPTVDTLDSQQPSNESKGRSFGIGIVDLMALGTSLVQSRKSRYTDRSTEDVRGRSRKDRRQERAEQAAIRKEEAREAREKAKREKEEDREVIRLAREDERLKKEADKEAERISKEEAARQKEADQEAERMLREEISRQREAAKEAERIANEEELHRIEAEKEFERLTKEKEELQKRKKVEDERRRQEELKIQLEADKREKENVAKAAKEEERRRSNASKQSERLRKEAAKNLEKQEKEAKIEAEKAAKEEARRQSAASKESERIAKEAAKEEKRIAKEEARLKKEAEKEAEQRAKEDARSLKESLKVTMKFDKPEPIEPVVYIGQNVYIKDFPSTGKSSSPNLPLVEPEEVVNYHEIVENVKVSVPVNTLIASLVHSSFESKPITEATPKPLLMSTDRPSRYSAEVDNESQFMRQRDPSQSSLLRSRYSQEPQPRQSSADAEGKPHTCQRDPSQSSLLRKRYPSGYIKQTSEDDESSIQGPQLMHQRDPSQSSLLRKRYSRSIDRSYSMGNGSAQLDPSGEPAEKISKNVSFEYDKELDEGVYGGVTEFVNSSADIREKMEWIERTYNTR